MRIRLRGPAGASTITLNKDATVADLKNQITEKTALNQFDIKYSYPPKPLQLPHDETLLSELSVKLDGEQLTISARGGGVVSGKSADVTESPNISPSADLPKFAGRSSGYEDRTPEVPTKQQSPIPLQRKGIAKDTPELPLPDRGATLGKPFSFSLFSDKAH
jgi:ubiquitin thioesterase OTU1